MSISPVALVFIVTFVAIAALAVVLAVKEL